MRPAGAPPLTAQTAERCPQSKARIAGIFYLLMILTASFALLFHGPLRSALLLGSTGSAIAAVVSLIGCALSVLGLFHLVSMRPNPLVFFGGYCLAIGYLVLRSTFLPRILGVLMALGGLGWLTFVSPALSQQLLPYNMAPGILGETALTVWLLAVGVNALRWNEQASAAA